MKRASKKDKKREKSSIYFRAGQGIGAKSAG
jgi:hypothetical protein